MGKTYEMLSEGAARLRAGVDVVVGVVETHGRRETEALTHPFTVIPRKLIDHQGRTLTEMDIDTILSRRPALVLVDELAHTNAPGSRHPKRWQDVEELLDAGIDVYSTVNIQHLESLNDVVASFTRVRVRETVPDRVLENAEIEIVDIPPDELIERLKEGKVYVPEEASRALTHFFSKSNLSALRELALRRAAQAVDAQMLDYLRAHALGGSFAAGERVLVAVNERPEAIELVRAAKRLADALRAPWTAVHIETSRSAGFTPAERQMLARTIALAAQLGAATASIPAASVVPALTAYARDVRATQIVLGKSARSWWFELRHGSVVDRIVRSAEGLAIHVLPIDAVDTQRPQRAPRLTLRQQINAKPYLWSASLVAGTAALGVGMLRLINFNNVAMLFLLPVLAAASRFGLRPGIFAGVISALAYNFFFLEPLYTFSISNPENVIAFVVLLVVATVTSQFAASVRVQADLAARSAKQNAALAGFSQAIAAAANPTELAQAICAEVGRLFDVQAVLLVPGPGGGALVAAIPPDAELGPIDIAAANWALDRGLRAGRDTDTLTSSDWLFQPIRKEEGVLAAIGVARFDETAIRADELPLLVNLLDQAALALDRMTLAEAMRDLDDVRNRDRLRSALLSSVSHDLRTPITTILGTIGELRRTSLDPEATALVDALDSEVARLNRFVANLLDMARVQAGAIRVAVEPVDLTDAVASACHDVRRVLQGHDIRLDVPPDLPMVRADPQLLHHILINLLDNAGRYADANTEVMIAARRSPGGLTLSIRDQGDGLPEGMEEAVFETFTRFDGSDRSRGGTGLGLAIARDFARAMDIGISAETCHEPQGSRFSLAWPEHLIVRADPNFER
ncbi:two-component system, OmpR family, sensor histidine kinase KdpD [Sphingomonas sp. YR710]|nr:two-component system, OmpR family, sensor histidine kinase KdpD [Sphingomonas sp. YR710]